MKYKRVKKYEQRNAKSQKNLFSEGLKLFYNLLENMINELNIIRFKSNCIKKNF